MLDTKYNYTFKTLKTAWYLLIPGLFLAANEFYQHYYRSEEPFLLYSIYDHYFKKLPQDLFMLPYHIYLTTAVLVIGSLLLLFFNPFEKWYRETRLFGSARWASVSDVIKVGLLRAFRREHKNGTFICRYNERYNLLLDQPLSVLLLAPPGTGKTAGVAIPSLFMAKNSIICLDVKGELFEITSKHRHTFSDIMVFNPTEKETSRWNPLDKTALPEDFSEIYVHVQNVAACIWLEQKGENPHWNNAAKKIFTSVAIALIQKNGGTSIPEIRLATLPKEDISRQEHIADLSEIEGLYEPVASELRAMKSVSENQFSGEIGTFDTGLEAFTDPRVSEAVSRNEIRYDELRGTKGRNGRSKTLYLIIRPRDVDRLAPLIRIFFETLTKHLLSTKWHKQSEHMITMMLDEFPRLGKMKEIMKMPALSRGQGVNVYLIAQDASQIEAEYEKTGREEIMSTTAYKIVLSQNSYDTAEMISKTIGDKTINVKSASKNKAKLLEGSDSYREQGVRLIKPQEIESLKMWHCIVLAQFSLQTPIKGTILKWWKERELKDLAGTVESHLIYRPKRLDEAEQREPAEQENTIELPSDEIIQKYYTSNYVPVSMQKDTDNEPEPEEEKEQVEAERHVVEEVNEEVKEIGKEEEEELEIDEHEIEAIINKASRMEEVEVTEQEIDHIY